ncbi:MAG: hypothetical protein H6Q90_737 [Deltaproteobacteria bacterium]|nr:hypothetical protein [Deltaproteobacteria bacterium]
MKTLSFHDVPIYDERSESRRILLSEIRGESSARMVGALAVFVLLMLAGWVLHVGV